VRTPLALLVLLITAALLGGCSSDDAQQPSGTGSMGMGGEGETSGMIAGAIAAEKNASIAPGVVRVSGDKLVVPRLSAPVDGWLAVRSLSATGPVLGFAPVSRGENRDVTVSFKGGDSDQVRLVLHVDRGARGTWEYDPANPTRGMDRPVYVDRKVVEREVALRAYGVDVPPHEISLWAEPQPASGGKVRVEQALAPPGSWIAVHVLEDGVRGRLLGFTGISGEAFEIDVPIEDPKGATMLAVSLFADKGAGGSFEYSSDAPLSSPDQPLKTGHELVTRPVPVQ